MCSRGPLDVYICLVVDSEWCLVSVGRVETRGEMVWSGVERRGKMKDGGSTKREKKRGAG